MRENRGAAAAESMIPAVKKEFTRKIQAKRTAWERRKHHPDAEGKKEDLQIDLRGVDREKKRDCEPPR